MLVLRTGACANAGLLTYLLTHINANLSGIIWHCARELNSITWLFRDSCIRKYQFTLHNITLEINAAATKIYFRHFHFVWTLPSCITGHSISRRVRFASSRRPAKQAFYRYRRGKLVIHKFRAANSNDTYTPMKDPPRLNMSREGACPLCVSTGPIPISSEHAPGMPLYPSIFGGMEWRGHASVSHIRGVVAIAISPPRRETPGSIPISTN